MQALINNILYEFLKDFVVIYLVDIIIYFKIKKITFSMLIKYLKNLKKNLKKNQKNISGINKKLIF